MGWDKLMETLRQRLKEQKAGIRRQQVDRHRRHSPFGAEGYNPEGIRIGQEKNRNFRREGVGQARVQGSRRQCRTRHPQHQDRAAAAAQIRPHRSADELDLDTTIKETAITAISTCYAPRTTQRGQGAGVLRYRRLDGFAHRTGRGIVFRAKAEFKHMEYFYFHNCLYEGVWKQNRRRFTDRTPTWDVLHKYPHDYKWYLSATPRCRLTKSWSPAARSSTSMRRRDRSGSSASRAPTRTRLAQSGGTAALGLFGIHHHHPAAVFGAHVPDHDRRS